jgi:hypothetical protein
MPLTTGTDELATAGRSILGPADVDDATFTAIVAAALDEPPGDVVVLDSTASVVAYALDAITTAGRYWVTARAATPAGEREVRMFVKHVQSWSRSPLFQHVPVELRAVAEAGVPWRTEPLIYQTDLSHRLPPGLTMPRALHVAFLDEASAVIWLPALDVVDHDWRTADFARAAHLLGRLAGSAEVAELGRVGEPAGGPLGIRSYAGGRLAVQVAPLLRSGALWQVPWVGDAFDAGLRARLLDALDEVPAWVDEVESGPQGVAHGDACPNNLLHTAGSDDITLIDYGFWSRQGIGFDLGQLLVGEVQLGRRGATTLPELEAACLPAYVDGLHAEGVELDVATVARAHALHLMVFTGLSTPLTDPSPPDAGPAELAAEAHTRADIARFCLGLVEATSG